MSSAITSVKQTVLSVALAILLVAFHPVVAFATTEPTAPVNDQTAVITSQKEDPDYVMNEETGLWESDKYTWNPTTQQTAPKTQTDYSYNPTTSQWDTTEWESTESGKYEANVVTPPVSSSVSETETDTATKTSTPTSPTVLSQHSALSTSSSDQLNQANQASLNNSGPDSTNQINLESTSANAFDLFFNASISNDIDSHAQSGDVTVGSNTTVGDAVSGTARAIVNVINLFSSQFSLAEGSAINTFVSDIFGDVFGDIVLDPSALAQQSASQKLKTEVDVNVEQNNQIDNDINLNAQSGGVTVEKNTTAGDASSGDAYAMANIVNAINSSIAADESFIGLVNIHGSLNGDILLPPDLVNKLLAHGGDVEQSTELDLDVDTTSNTLIDNNLNSTATSGEVTNSRNTTSGDATSGDASTEVTLLNLTGQQLVGKNAMLVFVNVFGNWVGLIMDAPTGSHTALIGDGSLSQSAELDADVDITTNNRITNNVEVTAGSGNVTADKNTTVGDLSSGDAHTAVNLVNIAGSNLDLSGWFGILFINIFDSWRGSFGVDTEAGEAPSLQPPRETRPAKQADKVFDFRPNKPQTGEPASATFFQTTYRVASATDNMTSGTILPRNTTSVNSDKPTTATKSDEATETEFHRQANNNWLWSALGVALGTSLLGTSRWLAIREGRG